ncbi:MAG TPA: hypothetical protein VHZ03_12745 [Trebonia sp.]|jgi:GTPase SAR1 family protein|nr:hypothetical protein [Trebonia sp.]
MIKSEPFRVAVAGPSRVGKTTLVTAILEDTKTLLGGTPVSVVAAEKTASLVRENRMQLRRAIALDRFDAGSLGGSQELSQYDLLLQADSNLAIEVPFTILDYPGGWLDPDNRDTEQVNRDWARCEEHVRHSIMLLVPIDAAVLMEATTPVQKAAAQDLLGIVDVEQIAEHWAKGRQQNSHEPAVVVLAPLKCEKYFHDNGGAGREAGQLSQAVAKTYNSVLDTIRRETPRRPVRVVYAPIDTYGCVELKEAEWISTSAGLLFKGCYRWRSRPPVVRVKAAATIMQELCKCIVDGEKNRAREDESHITDEIARRVQRQQESKGFWEAMQFRVSGAARRNRMGIALSARELSDTRRLVGQLEDALEKLATMPADERVQQW